jgi:hypothetical protein
MNSRLLYLLLATLFFSSCQKLLDYYNVNTDKPHSVCRIESIKHYGDNNELYREMVFQYTPEGELTAAIEAFPFEDPEGAYTSQWEFMHDEHGRLIRTGPWSTPRPFATVYAYEGSARLPARDTLLGMGGFTVEYFDYDERGRIIEIAEKVFFYNEEGEIEERAGDVYRYYYDLRGNRQENPANPYYKGLIQYSDKPSLYSLHPAFQLEYKNWSTNSTWSAESYNDKGLPTKTSSEGIELQPFLDTGPGQTISYVCE